VAAAAGADVAASGSITAETFVGADTVLEAVVEDADVKLDVLGRVEPLVAPDALLTTNTSSLRISDLATALRHPERFGGLHFLHPADRTAVVEIVRGDRTSAATVDRLVEFAERLKKVPIRVGLDVPGFIWNRLQFALLREAIALVEDGVADVATVDDAVSKGLAPRWVTAGPFRIADRGGIRTFARIAAELFPTLASSPEVPTGLLERARDDRRFYD
jgi:3-hydroxybutyryl-CoA dehydrogenase